MEKGDYKTLCSYHLSEDYCLLYVLNLIKKGKLKVPNNLVLVNGNIRGKNNKLNKLTKGKDVDIVYKKGEIYDKNFILFDDSYYSGSTKNAIDKYLRKFGSRVSKTYVLYDGNDIKDKNRKYVYNYYDYNKGTERSPNTLLNFLYDMNPDVPTDNILNDITSRKIRTFKELIKSINKLLVKFGKPPIDDRDFNYKQETTYESFVVSVIDYL